MARMVAWKTYFGTSSNFNDTDEARRCRCQGHERPMKTTTKELDVILEGWLEEHPKHRVKGEVKADGVQDFINLMLSLQEEG
ncbi:hypothetical protein TanjilG_05320 [Lupinus angustifolius]|uniref:Uncharacterized protein n=1 Tax=Lupinus angustifolius TaxID=3871 RepID=A0A1J7HKS8_LUPAN|nr:hypothetical protein TanjilG_05320 [Lupinus angustifolius]